MSTTAVSPKHSTPEEAHCSNAKNKLVTMADEDKEKAEKLAAAKKRASDVRPPSTELY